MTKDYEDDVCENCATSDPEDGVELRGCGHVLCERCFAGDCPICKEEADE
jgi:hypothetical protein